MTAVRWLVEHADDQLRTGGLVEYPDEPTADRHAGTAATVWALVPPEVVRVLEAAVAWREEHARWERDNPYHGASSADVLALIATVDAVNRPADPFAAIADAHPLSFESRSPLLRASCGCGWRGDYRGSERLAFADHAAHVHVAAGLATEEDA